jgi:carbon-monoxide dehydrogenase medium subunit
MHAFEYHRPSSMKDALSLGTQKPEGRFLAGGQSLVQAMKLRLSSPTDLIDLAAISDLKALSADANSVSVGAMVRHADVAGSSAVPFAEVLPPA